MWGPFVETADEEKIAEGHESVRSVVDTVLKEESEPTESVQFDTRECVNWDCDNAATHTVEVSTEYKRFIHYRCCDCIEANNSRVARVDEGLGTGTCENERCFNVVHD